MNKFEGVGYDMFAYAKEIILALAFSRVGLYLSYGDPMLALVYSSAMSWLYVMIHACYGREKRLPYKYTWKSWVLIAFNIWCAYKMVEYVMYDLSHWGYNFSRHVDSSYNWLQILFYLIVGDVVYYGFHRIIHWGVLYQWIHKIHHSAKNWYGVDIFYMHPIENIFTVGSFFIGAMWWRPESPIMVLDLVTIAAKTTLWAHCSGNICIMPKPVHYLHHKLHKFNYSNVFMDYIFGSYTEKGLSGMTEKQRAGYYHDDIYSYA